MVIGLRDGYNTLFNKQIVLNFQSGGFHHSFLYQFYENKAKSIFFSLYPFLFIVFTSCSDDQREYYPDKKKSNEGKHQRVYCKRFVTNKNGKYHCYHRRWK